MKKLLAVRRWFAIAGIMLLVLGVLAVGGLRSAPLAYGCWSLAGAAFFFALLYALAGHVVAALKGINE